jgi:hypothetical protein
MDACLAAVAIPASCNRIEMSIFDSCVGLTITTIPPGCPVFNSSFENCAGLGPGDRMTRA